MLCLSKSLGIECLILSYSMLVFALMSKTLKYMYTNILNNEYNSSINILSAIGGGKR